MVLQNMSNDAWIKNMKLSEILNIIDKSERANRNSHMNKIMRDIENTRAGTVSKGKIEVIPKHQRVNCPLALYINEDGKPQCAPIDQLAISFYEYELAVEEDKQRRPENPTLRKGLEIHGPLALVNEATGQTKEMTFRQLIAIQSLIGNDSTWWPVTDYSEEQLKDVFAGLELNVILFHEVPIGIAHLDYVDLEDKKAVKIVFIGIDPEMQGKGLGREILHAVMTHAIDRGAEKIYLDTVSHRDIRTYTSKGAVKPGKPQGTAHDVYVKSGFKMVDVKLIDPANKKQLEEEGLTINQLNGPLEYRFKDLSPLRAAVDESFGVPASKRQALSEMMKG
jgi:GNAT superfamily N-acetyltransferase